MNPAQVRREFRAMCRLIIAAAMVAAMGACATPMHSPPRYVQSPAYHAIAQSVAGVLQEGPHAILARRSASGGLAVQVLAYDASQEPAAAWPVQCTSEGAAGEDIGTLAWAGPPGARMVLLTGVEENPEELVHSVRLVDPNNCASHLSERLRLAATEPGTPRIPVVALSRDGQTLRLFDHLDTLSLQGADGPFVLPVRCRERCTLLPPAGEPVWKTESRGVLVQAAMQTHWTAIDPGNPNGAAAPQDPNAAGEKATPAGEGADLRVPSGWGVTIDLQAPMPLVLLEVHHGCNGADETLVLEATSGGKPYKTGSLPAAGSFVRAVGRRHNDASFGQDLLFLRQPSDAVHLRLAPSSGVRCLREVVGYTFLQFEGLTDGPCG